MRKKSLTVEAIINRAFELGALSASSDIRPDLYKRISIEWPSYDNSTEWLCFWMQGGMFYGWQQNWGKKLPEMLKVVERWGATFSKYRDAS